MVEGNFNGHFLGVIVATPLATTYAIAVTPHTFFRLSLLLLMSLLRVSLLLPKSGGKFQRHFLGVIAATPLATIYAIAATSRTFFRLSLLLPMSLLKVSPLLRLKNAFISLSLLLYKSLLKVSLLYYPKVGGNSGKHFLGVRAATPLAAT